MLGVVSHGWTSVVTKSALEITACTDKVLLVHVGHYICCGSLQSVLRIRYHWLVSLSINNNSHIVIQVILIGRARKSHVGSGMNMKILGLLLLGHLRGSNPAGSCVPSTSTQELIIVQHFDEGSDPEVLLEEVGWYGVVWLLLFMAPMTITDDVFMCISTGITIGLMKNYLFTFKISKPLWLVTRATTTEYLFISCFISKAAIFLIHLREMRMLQFSTCWITLH